MPAHPVIGSRRVCRDPGARTTPRCSQSMPRIPPTPASFAIALAILFALPGALTHASPGGPGLIAAASLESSTPIALSINETPIELNASFWGTTVSAHPPLFANLSSIVRATPASYVVWPGANEGDDYDYQTGLIWSQANTAVPANTTEAEFAAWCLATGCRAIVEVPGVIDDPAFAKAEVNYTEGRLGLHPAFWEIGNEPGFWQHWNQSWGNWTTKVPGPTAMQYAEEVRNYTLAMREADPTLRLIGLPAVGRTGPGGGADVWIDDILRLDGPNLSAIAVHIYPDLNLRLSTLPQYFSTLTSGNSASIPSRVPKIRAEIAAAAAANPGCSCGSLPLLFTELGSAITGHPDGSAYAEQFPGALYIAAELTQAMDFNVTNVDAYATVLNTVNSWFNTSGQFRPEYTLYSTILPHLGPYAYRVNLTDPEGDVYAIATSNASDGGVEDLMVVNTDTVSSVSFAPELPGGLDGATETWSWVNSTTPAPVATYSAALPANYTLLPQSIALFESRPGPAEPVSFSESGLPSTARWFVNVDGRVRTAATENFSLLLPEGIHSMAAETPVPVPSETEHARWMPTVLSEFSVESGPVSASVPFALEYTLNLSVTPSGGGTAGSLPAWVPAGSPLLLTATPAPGYLFERWQGGGAGNYSGPSANATIVPLGPDRETAVFTRAYGEVFAERGLPDGEPWSVSIRNQTFTTASPDLTVVERNGTYGYSVTPVSGYTPHPAAGAFAANGSSPTVVTIDFVSPLFRVTFIENGLPDGLAWSVTLDNHTGSGATSNSSTLSFYLTNGKYGYRIPAVDNYSADPGGGSLTVAGGPPPVIQISFTRAGPGVGGTVYSFRFHEQGLPAGQAWTVTISTGSADPVYWSSSTDNLTVNEPNGTYSYGVGSVPGYIASPATGTVFVNGSGGHVAAIAFHPLTAGTGVVEFPGLWTGVLRAAAVAAVIGLTGFATFGALYWRRRRPPGTPSPVGSESASSAPPDFREGGHSGAG